MVVKYVIPELLADKAVVKQELSFMNRESLGFYCALSRICATISDHDTTQRDQIFWIGLPFVVVHYLPC